jgi:hypothetical protein
MVCHIVAFFGAAAAPALLLLLLLLCPAGARGLLREVTDLLDSGLPCCAAGSSQPMTLHQMDLDRGHPVDAAPTTAVRVRDAHKSDVPYMSDAAFAGFKPGRLAYDAAAQDLCTNRAHIRLLASRLSAPQAARGVHLAAAAAAAAAAEHQQAAGVAGVQSKLQEAIEELQQRQQLLEEKEVPAEQVQSAASRASCMMCRL